MIDLVDLSRRLAGKHVKDDSQMPAAYRKGARDRHDDWGIPPLTLIPRRWTWYNLSLPFHLLKWWGQEPLPRWMAWQEGYPEAPGAVFRKVIPGTAAWDLRERFGKPIEREVLAFDPVLPIGQAALFGVWLDGAWRPCYYTKTSKLFGRRLHINYILKFDMTWGDFGCQWPDASCTWTAQ